MSNNIVKCGKCKAPLISEELDSHECFTKTLVFTKFYATTGNYYFHDGKRWYRWFPKSDDLLHLNIITSTDEDDTEPYAQAVNSPRGTVLCAYQRDLVSSLLSG